MPPRVGQKRKRAALPRATTKFDALQKADEEDEDGHTYDRYSTDLVCVADGPLRNMDELTDDGLTIRRDALFRLIKDWGGAGALWRFKVGTPDRYYMFGDWKRYLKDERIHPVPAYMMVCWTGLFHTNEHATQFVRAFFGKLPRMRSQLTQFDLDRRIDRFHDSMFERSFCSLRTCRGAPITHAILREPDLVALLDWNAVAASVWLDFRPWWDCLCEHDPVCARVLFWACPATAMAKRTGTKYTSVMWSAVHRGMYWLTELLYERLLVDTCGLDNPEFEGGVRICDYRPEWSTLETSDGSWIAHLTMCHARWRTTQTALAAAAANTSAQCAMGNGLRYIAALHRVVAQYLEPPPTSLPVAPAAAAQLDNVPTG
jgi:hypothetical protein